MGQITIYIDDDTIKMVEKAAKRERSSVSRWVKKRLAAALKNEWPKGYFSLFGLIKNKDLGEIDDLPFTLDSKREDL